MAGYINTITCSTNDTRSEVFLSFLQRRPVLDNDGKVSGTTTEEVASVVLNKDGVESLKQLLNSILPD